MAGSSGCRIRRSEPWSRCSSSGARGRSPGSSSTGRARWERSTRRARFAALLPLFQRVIERLAGFPAPTIAALNGFATGAGFDLALACDLRIASERAKLGSAYVSLGLVPDGGGTFHLPHLVGPPRAAEMILLGEALAARRTPRRVSAAGA